MGTEHPMKEIRPRWELVTLVGGPADGERVEVPLDAEHYVSWHGCDSTEYIRRGRSKFFDSEDRLARLLGGGRR